jgi:hypothetical protein
MEKLSYYLFRENHFNKTSFFYFTSPDAPELRETSSILSRIQWKVENSFKKKKLIN